MNDLALPGAAERVVFPPAEPHRRMRDRRPFVSGETHCLTRQPGTILHASSEDFGWWPVFVSVQTEGPYRASLAPCSDELLIVHRGPARVERVIAGQHFSQMLPAGYAHFIPSGQGGSLRLLDSVETVHIYLRRRVLEKVALEMIDTDPATVSLPARSLEVDPILAGLIQTTTGMIEGWRGAHTSASAFFLACSIAAHLIRTGYPGRLKGEAEGSPRMWSAPVSRAVRFMRDRLDQPLTHADIANAAGRSPSQLARVFRDETGISLHKFLIRLRAEKAQGLLHKSSLPIAEIAQICGFSNQEHLTNIFRRAYGETPAAYRRLRRAHETGEKAE